jgi:hypothetical protein
VPTPLITASTRYMDIGVTKVYWIPTISAATLFPTRAEMNLGTDLTPEITDFSGWTLSAELIDTQNITSIFKTTIAGSVSAPECTMTFFTSKNGNDVRTLLFAGATGNIMFCDGGDVTGNKAEIWPTSIGTDSVIRIAGGSTGTASSTITADASKILVQFVITKAPVQRVPIP